MFRCLTVGELVEEWQKDKGYVFSIGEHQQEKEIRSSPMSWLSIHMLLSPVRLSQYYNESRTITRITGRISISFY